MENPGKFKRFSFISFNWCMLFFEFFCYSISKYIAILSMMHLLQICSDVFNNLTRQPIWAIPAETAGNGKDNV